MKGKEAGQKAIRTSRFPIAIFFVFLLTLLLMSGVHIGIITLANEEQWPTAVQILLPTLYWGLVAVGLTLFTRWEIRRNYEEPMRNLRNATEKVANGDFSVYVPPLHSVGKLDYLDAMILDFNKMVEELGSVETLKTDFISNVSHEMKTPIAIIKNYAQLIQMENTTEEEKLEYAENIEAAAERLAILISNILKLNKLENQRIDPDIEVYDLCRQLEDCILQYEEMWDKKDLNLEVEMEDRAMVQADPSLMELVWNNLLSNAIKFTDPGGSVQVRQKFRDSFIEVEVTDTGCGMNRESVKHIFDKFYQGDTSHSKEGNGLGLALVKRVLVLMDGEISVKSEEGKGSTFKVILPKAEQTREQAEVERNNE